MNFFFSLDKDYSRPEPYFLVSDHSFSWFVTNTHSKNSIIK